jgi:hypothetical protein
MFATPPTSPTTLVAPPAIDHSIAHGAVLSPSVWIIVALAAIGLTILLIHRRQRQADPCELAFRTVSRKMGLNRNEITQIRRHATEIDGGSPVAILLSPELTARALNI